jgi:hypothetical protein
VKPIATVHWTEDGRNYSESFWTSDRLKGKVEELYKQEIIYVLCVTNTNQPLPRVAHQNGARAI